jgi:alginate O-acetyltransferase complex protein AlgI
MRLPTNFMHPYTSASVAEFWRRWHITLSTWLRDYLYIPLGGNRASRGRRIANVMITMGLGGLWHGANWTFVIWGLLHGMAISFAHLFRRPADRDGGRSAPRWLLVVITFHFVTLCWIPFRAPNLETAGRVLQGAFMAPLGNLGVFAASHVFPLLLLALFLLTHRWDSHRSIRRGVHVLPQPVFWPMVVLVWVLAITVSAGSSAKFIYFDF